MAVKSKDDLIASIKAVIGEATTDESIALLEDVSDTFGEFESNNNVDWKAKYEANDAEWRKRYRDRFYGDVEEEDDFSVEEPKVKRTYADLFTTV